MGNRIEQAPQWLTLIGKSEAGDRDYKPRVEGEIPQQLRGSIYRNGPGLFERGESSIKHLLDGDGLVQRLGFSDEGVSYQNRFVATDKFTREQKAGRRLYSTWTTRKSPFFLNNLGGRVKMSQAGVTVYPVYGKLLARDELGPHYEIDCESLETIGKISPAGNFRNVSFKAHSKFDLDTQEWVLAGNKFGRNMFIFVAIYEPGFKMKTRFSFAAPRQVYFHDFLMSRNYVIFLLHPCFLGVLPFLLGLKSFKDCLNWQAAEGNLIAVVPRDGGSPAWFETPGSFMWHGLNAFERGDELVVDFVGYDTPDHFIGKNALAKTIMSGRMGYAQSAGKIRRDVLDLKTGHAREEIIDLGNHEFPMLDLRSSMIEQKFGYFCCNGLGACNSGLKRLDYSNGDTVVYDFGSRVQVGEPVFARHPEKREIDRGWLICQCLDGDSGKSFFAIFDAGSIERGPLAKIWLRHPVPISFHGCWKPAYS